MTTPRRFFVTCAKGVEDLLLRECEQAGIAGAQPVTGGVGFDGQLADAYELCMWSRVGSRVLLQLEQGPVGDDDELYRFARDIDWSQHLDVDGTLAIDCATSHAVIDNSHFAALRLKDAIVDQMRSRFERRPSVDKLQPHVRINLYLHDRAAILYIDLSGEALHRRGYRLESGGAPLRETLAAAMLYRCKWPAVAAQGGAFVDIMCGSGTLLIEAASMAAGRAPQHGRERFGFSRWKQHDPAAWEEVCSRAAAAAAERPRVPVITGFERSHRIIDIARRNIDRAGFGDVIEVRQADSLEQNLRVPGTPGLVLTNPPYGKRLGDSDGLVDTYRGLGRCFKQQFGGWQAALITSEKSLAGCVGLRAHHRNTLYNGALRCTLYQYRMRAAQPQQAGDTGISALHENAVMLLNRLTKNARHLRKWAAANAVTCYRVYDADLPQYAVAIDNYDGEYVVQEYQAPKAIPAGKALTHLNDVIEVVQRVFGCKREAIILKTRSRQSGSSQYTALDATGAGRTVVEDGLRFEVNLHDYLDTGLFLDHRDTRRLVRRLAAGRSVLNLFAYTGSFSVYAAAGGASRVTTVDMSNTYIEWAKRNMALNGLASPGHLFVRADCLQWMQQVRASYQLILLDPPTFSNSAKMEETLDIRRDHVALIRGAMALLEPGGVLIFSTNAKKFKLDTAALDMFAIKDISAQTLTEDFKRRPAHRCWCLGDAGDELVDCRPR